jgi:hypothetical protein
VLEGAIVELWQLPLTLNLIALDASQACRRSYIKKHKNPKIEIF